MKCLILFIFLLIICVSNAKGVCSVSSWTQESYNNSPNSCPQDGNGHGITSTAVYGVCWSDSTITNVSIWALGGCYGNSFCTPFFYGPYLESGATKAWFKEKVQDRAVNSMFFYCTNDGPQLIKGSSHTCARGGMCGEIATSDSEQPANLMRSESCCSGEDRLACYSFGGVWDEDTCGCYSPIIIDTTGNGFNLTNAVNGVLFDLMNDGIKERLSWTAANSDDAFLVLDRNQNGVIDSGRELFGSSTLQPVLQEGETKHGFRALAIYDKSDRGGNNDNQIDSNDAVFSSLKLWRDSNHNGESEANELQKLSESDVTVIELDYHESRRKDEHGNWFRYRAKVRDAHQTKVGRWAWDVFLQSAK